MPDNQIPQLFGPPVNLPITKPIPPPPTNTTQDVIDWLTNPQTVKAGLTTLGSGVGTALRSPLLGALAGAYAGEAIYPHDNLTEGITDPVIEAGKVRLGDKLAGLGLKAGGLGIDLSEEVWKRISGQQSNNLMSILAARLGKKPSSFITTSPFDPNYNSSLEPVAKYIQQEKAPVTLGELTNSNWMREFEKATNNPENLILNQNLWSQNKFRELMGLSPKAATRYELLRMGAQKRVEWIAGKNKALIPFIEKAPTDLKAFREVALRAGPDKAHAALFGDMLDNSIQDGIFNGGNMVKYMRDHRDFFNENAKYLEKLGFGRASDLKAAWNRFAQTQALMNAGRATDSRGIEMALTSAGISAAVGIPILGAASYPVWRAIATGGKFSIVGPALGKMFRDPHVVEQFIKLSTSSAKNPANLSRLKEIAKYAWRNGIAFTGAGGTEFMINPSDMKPVIVDPANAPNLQEVEIPKLFN